MNQVKTPFQFTDEKSYPMLLAACESLQGSQRLTVCFPDDFSQTADWLAYRLNHDQRFVSLGLRARPNNAQFVEPMSGRTRPGRVEIERLTNPSTKADVDFERIVRPE